MPTSLFIWITLLILVLALLVSHGAGGLASGLARSLALAAAALGSAVLQSGTIESLNVLHGIASKSLRGTGPRRVTWILSHFTTFYKYFLLFFFRFPLPINPTAPPLPTQAASTAGMAAPAGSIPHSPLPNAANSTNSPSPVPIPVAIAHSR